MKRYKTKYQEYSRKLFTHQGRNVFDIEHSMDRFHERFPDLSDEDWNRIMQKGIDFVLDLFKDSIGKYIFVSKKNDVAIQVDWRIDNKSNNNLNHAFTSTTLEYSVHKNMLRADTKLFVEEIKKYHLEEGFISKSYKNMLKETNFYLDIKLEENKDYKIYIHKGKIYKNFEVIEID
jgi:hypothetical protein